MTLVSKRSVLKLAALSTVAAAVLVGCGKKEEPKPAAAPKPAGPPALVDALASRRKGPDPMN